MYKKKYISVVPIVGEIIADYDLVGRIEEDTYMRWASEAIELLVDTEVLMYGVTFVDVKNHTADVPKDLHSIYLVGYTEEKKRKHTRESIVGWTEAVCGTDCEVEINLKCPDCKMDKCGCSTPFMEFTVDDFYIQERPWLRRINNVNLVTYATPNTDMGACCDSFPGFKLMRPRLSNDVWWNSEYFLGVCNSLGENLNMCPSFEIQDDKFITDIKEGQLVVSYLYHKKDEDGYFMLPNVAEAVVAVKAYITKKIMWRRQMAHNGNQTDRLNRLDADNEWVRAAGAARQVLELPDADKWISLWNRHIRIDRNEHYYGSGHR